MQFFYENKGPAINVSYTFRLGCGRHLHNHVELVLMHKGVVTVTLDDFEADLHPGEAFISFPNQVHSYQDHGKNESLIMIFPPDAFPEYSKIFRNMVPTQAVVPYNQKLLNPIGAELLRQSKIGDSIASGMVKGCLLVILGSLFESMNFKQVETADLSILKSILIYCGQNFEHEITLGEVAENLHISKYYISHLFSGKMKISFPDYINNLRILEASRLLKDEDLNITEVSFTVGFSSIRSFNRNFLKIMGISPREYRASLSLT